MGTDINAWVERRLIKSWGPTWYGVVDAGVLLRRNYDAFGCLFGVRNSTNHAPIASARGIPADASDRVRYDLKDLGSDDESEPSWVTWAELAVVDWDEKAPHPHECLRRYRHGDDGALIRDPGYCVDDAMLAHPEISALLQGFGDSNDDPWIWPDGAAWTIGEYVYRAEKISRRESLDDGWWTVFALMRTLAERFGDHQVRLVAWFN